MLMVVEFILFLFLQFSSSRCFTLGSTRCERKSLMEFSLGKLKVYVIQSEMLLFTDFSADSFWSRFQKLAVLDRIF